MKQKYLTIAVISIYLFTTILSFNSSLMGGDPKLHITILSILYIISFSAYIVLSRKNKKAVIFSLVWSLISLFGCTVSLVNNIYSVLNGEHLVIDFILPVALLVFPSLYGVVETVPNGTAFVVAICVIWSLVCAFNLRKNKTNNRDFMV